MEQNTLKPHNNLGNLYKSLDKRFEEAIDCYKKAITEN